MTADAPSRLTRDVWLGQRIGKQAWKLDTDTLDSDLLASVLDEVGHGEAFVYTKVATDQVSRVGMLEDYGFHVVDTSVTLHRPTLSDLPSPSSAVRLAVGDDEQGVRQLAGRAFSQSRFHVDPLIPAGCADSLKSDWAGGFFSGERGDWMVVAGEVRSPVGFLQLLQRGDCLVIDLVAVDEQARGRGLMGEMLGFAARSCEGIGQSEVGTQSANVRSLRAYERLGFRVLRTEYVLHWHRR